MGAGGKIALAGLGVLAVVGATAAARTTTFKPPAQVDLKSVVFAPAPQVDADAAARRLGEAIRFQTVTHQNPAEDQLDQFDKLEAWLVTSYPAAHKAMSRELVDGHTLLYTWKGSDPALKPIILMAHQDVVPVTAGTEGDWKHAPFSGDIADGYVWGRGAVDDKSSLIATLEAIELLTTKGFQPKRTVILVSGHNEETRAGGAKAAAELLKARGVKAEFVLDEGFSGTTRDAFTGKPLVRVQVAEKGYGTLRLTAKADGGHSSAPPNETAVATLARAVLAVTEKPFAMRLKGPVRDSYLAMAPGLPVRDRVMLANLWLFEPWMTRRIAADPAGAAGLHTTIAPTMLEGSPKENVLPQKAIARINYRFAPGDSSDAVMARAKKAVGELPVEVTWERPPFEATPVSSTTSPGWKAVAGLAAQTTGAPVVPGLMRAGTDSWFLRPVATDTYLYTPLILSPTEEKMVHGTNEKVSVKDLGGMVSYYARLIQTTAG